VGEPGDHSYLLTGDIYPAAALGEFEHQRKIRWTIQSSHLSDNCNDS
jgi:hypothetical protein